LANVSQSYSKNKSGMFLWTMVYYCSRRFSHLNDAVTSVCKMKFFERY